MPKQKYYAVASGRKMGVYHSWEECKAQVHGYSGAKYKSFQSFQEAQAYVSSNRNAASKNPPSKQPLTTHHASKYGETSRKRPRADTQPPAATTTSTVTTATSSISRATKRMKQSLPDGGRVQVKLMFDGGARGNPGIAGAGAAVTVVNTRTIHIRDFVGTNSTNNEAEYRGLIAGLQVALQQHKMDDLVVQGDSQLIVKQLKGEYKVQSKHLRPLFQQTQALLQQIEKVHSCPVALEHVYRSDNKVADQLANEAMDAQKSWVTTSDDAHEEQHTLEAFSQDKATPPTAFPVDRIDV